MFENSKLTELMLNKIKQTKSICLKKNEKISSIFNSGLLKGIKSNNNDSKYNLVILCVGNNSNLVKGIFKNQVIQSSYEELSITTILNHNSLKNDTARQIFFENEILALLPISKAKTAVVWSVKNNMDNKSDIFLKNKIKLYAKNYLENISFQSSLMRKNLNFLIRNNYYQDRTLLFGDALHVLHPFVGQGFNMILRDLKSLETILSKKIDLGLDIGNSDILSEFSYETKPRNFLFSIGVDLLKGYFSYGKFRNNVLKILDKNNFAKDICFNIADKGFKF